MTELQRTEFNILKAVIDICDRFDIKYYLVCGSALGAAKYQGFIPWDDDIDIGIYRNDYAKFCKIAQKELPEYYFLQTYKTDPGYPMFFAKIRDSRTTYIEKSISELDVNHGVYIDIFPLDGYPIKKKEIVSFERRKTIYKLNLFCVYKLNDTYSFKAKVFFACERILGFHRKVDKIAQKIELLISKYPTETSGLICNHGNWQGKLEYAPKSQYGNGTWAMFEGLRVRIPEKYDEYLTQKYGDWRADLPDDQKVGHHYYEIMDLEHPYTDYIKKRKHNSKKIKLRKTPKSNA